MKSDSKIFVWLSGDVFSTNLQPSATDEEAKAEADSRNVQMHVDIDQQCNNVLQ